jgi:hypothetical protein
MVALSIATATKRSTQLAFDVREFRVRKNGLLQSILEAADSQIGYSAMCGFRSILINPSSNSVVTKLFSRPISEIHPQDIKLITQHIDKIVSEQYLQGTKSYDKSL